MCPVWHINSNSGVLALYYLILQLSFESPLEQALHHIPKMSIFFFCCNIMKNSAAGQKVLKNAVGSDLL